MGLPALSVWMTTGAGAALVVGWRGPGGVPGVQCRPAARCRWRWMEWMIRETRKRTLEGWVRLMSFGGGGPGRGDGDVQLDTA